MRHSTRGRSHFRVRLACVKHAASVQSEPESNSPVQICTKISAWQKSESQSSISTRSSLVNEPEKEFFTPAVFCGVCKHALLSPLCQQFFRESSKKLFVKAFRGPAVLQRRKWLLRSSLMSVNNFFLFFPEIFFPEPSEKGCFSGGERDVYAFSPGVSIPLEHFSKKAILTGAIRGPEPFHGVRLYLLSRSPSCCIVFPFTWIFR